MSTPLEVLIDAAVTDHAAARLLIHRYPELLSATYLLGETALHFLAVEGKVDGVRFLAEAGTDVNATNRFGDSALIDAATLGNAAIVRLLLGHGADPHARSATRDNAVHCAAGAGSPEALDALLAAGARADYVTDLGETVWDAVARHPDQREQLELVLQRHHVQPPTLD